MLKPLLAVAGLGLLASASAAYAQELEIGGDQRTRLELTLYGNGLALVKDRRNFELFNGLNVLTIGGVSPSMVSGSLRLDQDGPFRVFAQGFQAANLTHQALLEKHVGRTVTIVRTVAETGDEILSQAEVVAVDPQLILRIGGRIETSPPGRIAFENLPAGLRGYPVLRLSGRTAKTGRNDFSFRYLTAGLAWRAEHTAEFDQAAGRLNFSTWATLANTSGMTINADRVQLIAGQVRRLSRGETKQRAGLAMMMAADAAPEEEMAARENFGGYHLYTLPRPVALADGETRQVALLEMENVTAERQLVSDGNPNVFGPYRGAPPPNHPEIRIKFENPKSGGAGQPLPGGVLRLYGRDGSGEVQFMGEDRLRDLPVGATATVSGGRAFDVRVKRVQTDFRREGLGRNTTEAAFRIEVVNGGDEETVVRLVENIPGDWRILEESAPHQSENGRPQWSVTVPAKGKGELRYRVRVRR